MPFTLKPDLHKLVEGKYNYFNNDKNYAEEEFSLMFDKSKESYFYRSEVVSRLDNGSLNKTVINANSDRHFVISAAQINRTTGTKKSDELFTMDENNGVLHYTFKNEDETTRSERPWAQKHHLSLPCAFMSTHFLLNKKIDQTRATPLHIITSPNEFTHEGPLQEKVLWGLWKNIEQLPFILDNNTVAASDLELYLNDPSTREVEIPIKFKISKHFFIPYLIEGHDGVKIVIESLKRYEIDEVIKI